jgi:hypothetical protein
MAPSAAGDTCEAGRRRPEQEPKVGEGGSGGGGTRGWRKMGGTKEVGSHEDEWGRVTHSAITQPFHICGRPHQEFACCLLCSLRYLRIFSRILLHSLLTNDSSQRLIILHTHGLFNEIYKPCETNKIIDIILLTYKRCLTMRRVFHKHICLLYNSLKQQQTSILVLNKLDSLDIKLIGDKKQR